MSASCSLRSASAVDSATTRPNGWLTDRPYDVVVGPALIDELREGLARDRFRRWISTHESDLLVSGGSDLLDLEAEDVSILTPGELLAQL